MSWLTKVTDIAGRAEDLLNRFDQNAADALKRPRAGTPSAQSVQLTRVDSEVSLPNEVAVSEPAIDSPQRRPPRASYAASSSSRLYQSRKQEDDELISYLNEENNLNRKTHSRQSSDASRLSMPVPRTSAASNERPSSASLAAEASGTGNEAELRAQHADTVRCLHLKESQMAVMSVRLQEAEEESARKDARVGELEKENERLREDLRSRHVSGSAGKTLDEIKMEHEREKDEILRREMEHVRGLQKASGEKSELINELHTLRATLAETEVMARQSAEDLRLAKYNLEANKHEFDEYKQKAQKILSAKEKLLETLKQGGAETGSENTVNGVELEELRCERELLKEELQQSQLVIYNLKGDIQEMENRLREEQRAAGVDRDALLKQCHRHLTEANQYRESMDRTQLEYEFVQAEMRRQAEAVERKLADKDMELMKLMEERKSSKRYEAGEAEQRIALLSEKLIAKQTHIERLDGEKRALALRLERSEKAYRQAEAAAVKACAIDMRDAGSSGAARGAVGFLHRSPGDSPSTVVCKSVLAGVDLLGLRLANFMRNPVFRIFFFVYCALLHVWVFFVLLTYTPEIHASTPI